jgi:ribonuclease/clavin/mitogillin
VVIAAPEGDMTKYLNSLNYVINLRPRVIMPSHGMPMGGVHVLKKNLDHRLLRENQIMEFLNEGQSVEQMVESIYPNLPAEIKFLGRLNIESHLRRINETRDR